jgi:4-aminobutyrate aminotransferase-like enzyme
MSKEQSGFKSLAQDEHNLMHNDQIVERAKGSYVWMEGDPEPYLDFVMAYSSTNFGHLNPELLPAFGDATSDNVSFFSSRLHEQLIRELGEVLGLQGRWSFYFEVGGAMAVETAVRACLLAKPEGVLLSMTGAFHGYGAASRALTDAAFLHEDAVMSAAGFQKIPRPIDAGSVATALDELEKTLQSSRVSGVVIEPVQGAAGFIELGLDYLKGVRDLCDTYDVPLVFDEIQSAFFRCGSLTVSLDNGIVPDILLLSKSLGGGLAPISAVIMSGQFADKLPAKRAGFDSTFSGWTVGVAAALGVIELIKKSNFAAGVRGKGKLIDEFFDAELAGDARRSRIRRVGLGVAYDTESATDAEAIRVAALRRHLIVHTAGLDGTVVKFSPALTISDDDLKKGLGVFCDCLTNTTTSN